MAVTHLGLLHFVDFLFYCKLKILDRRKVHERHIYTGSNSNKTMQFNFQYSSVYRQSNHKFKLHTKHSIKCLGEYECTERGGVEFEDIDAHGTAEFEVDESVDIR